MCKLPDLSLVPFSVKVSAPSELWLPGITTIKNKGPQWLWKGLNNGESSPEEQIGAVLQNILYSRDVGPSLTISHFLIYTHSIKFRKKKLEAAQLEEGNGQKRRMLAGNTRPPGRRPKGNFKAGFSPRQKVSIPSLVKGTWLHARWQEEGRSKRKGETGTHAPCLIEQGGIQPNEETQSQLKKQLSFRHKEVKLNHLELMWIP